MNHSSTLYILLYKNGSFNIKGLNIVDRELFYKLSRDVIKGLGKAMFGSLLNLTPMLKYTNLTSYASLRPGLMHTNNN